MSADREYVLATARELYGRAVYTHKTHEKEREIWSGKACTMIWINIVLSAMTTLFAIISAWLKPAWALLATALSATATIAFVVGQSSFDPVGKESQHRTAAKELLWIREQLLLLITDCHIATINQEHLQRCLEMITRELTAVYKFAPNTSPEAYALAEKSIKSGHFTFSDDEIDVMLPVALRKNAAKA
ncbi:MAG: SLATT domain-containing protein [Terriglobales bacterium]